MRTQNRIETKCSYLGFKTKLKDKWYVQIYIKSSMITKFVLKKKITKDDKNIKLIKSMLKYHKINTSLKKIYNIKVYVYTITSTHTYSLIPHQNQPQEENASKHKRWPSVQSHINSHIYINIFRYIHSHTNTSILIHRRSFLKQR